MAREIVYVGCSVTNSSKEFEGFVAEFKTRLKSATDALVLDWIGKEANIELNNMYEVDINNVRRCDVMIALVDEPSIGLGMEIQYAIATGRHLLCLHHRTSRISRLLRGAAKEGIVPIRTYEDLGDALKAASDFINSPQKKRSVRKMKI